MNKVGLCLSEVELNDYLGGLVSNERKREVEKHLAECPACLEKLVFSYQTVKEFRETNQKGVKMKTSWKKNLWLFACLLTFALSFFVPRYFVQLLVATVLMGTKWIFDSVNARILIMIYDAWKHGGEHEASKVLRTLKNPDNPNNRFPRK